MNKDYLKLKGVLSLLLIVMSLFLEAATFRSVQTGDWDDASTWRVGAGAGGTVGVDYPSPTDKVFISASDTVYLDFGTTGTLYEYEGRLEVEFGGILWIEVGTNTSGLALINDARLFNRGRVYAARANEGPGTAGPIEIDIYLEDNAIFYAYENSFIYCADDVHIRDNAIFYVEVNVCIEIDDDFHLQGTNSFLCGDGGASIGVSTADNDVIFESGASASNICSGLTVFRGVGATCNPTSGTAIVTGTGPTNLRPRAVADNFNVAENTATNLNVLYQGDIDIDLDGPSLEIISAGSNAAINDNATNNGGTLSINNNGTPADFSDDYIIYTPLASFIGTDFFQYIIEDDDGATDTALVTIVVSCGPQSITTNNFTYATFESETNDVVDETNAEGAPDGNFAQIYNNNEQLILDMGQVYSAGTQYEITWRRKNSAGAGTSVIDLSESTLAASGFTNHPILPTTTEFVSFVTTLVTSNVDFRYLAFDKGNTSTGDYDIDAVGVISSVSCELDTDEDGIANTLDLDDDNDGILDDEENSTCTGFLNFEFYDGTPSGNTVDNIPTTGALNTGLTSTFDVDVLQGISDPGDANTYGIRFDGFIRINTTETYTFYTSSDDGSKLFVDGTEVVDNDFLQADTERSGTIALTPGVYDFRVLYFENTGDDVLTVSYSSPSISKIEIPFSILADGSSCDSDQDGIENSLDLDSDNDGISDIVEAGGIDSDGNGVVDVLTDTDNDGYVDLHDSDNGGTALANEDTDGDGLVNYVDIDSDGDGIVDVIEAQASTASPIVPSGNDDDNDGIDDNFDTDLGNSTLIPVNTDGADNPDYIDTDSDNDSDLDALEAYDTDNDGNADIVAGGSDSDGDGLDDNFDSVNGANATTNVTNGGQNSNTFPNLDITGTSELDWREIIDTDLDGIADQIDSDDDNDGIPDADENSNCNPSALDQMLNYEFYDLVPSGNTVDNIPTTGALSTGKVSEIDVDNLQIAVDPGDSENYSIRYSGFISIQTNETYTFTTSSDDGSKLFIDGNEIVDNDGNHGIRSRTGSVALTEGIYSITILFYENTGGDFLGVLYEAPSFVREILPFNVLSSSFTCDTDGDGIIDQLDLDSDGDGIADIIEAGGVDTDGDGRADDNTDTDEDGLADIFEGGGALPDDDQDGDGIPNRRDLDSDNDGITDNVEAQTTLGYAAPAGSDSDGDGMDDTYDSDTGTPISLSNFDGTGSPDYLDLDSDDDGLFDWSEGFDDNNTQDALDDYLLRADAFETAAGFPMYYINANDTDADGVPNWAEDDDADNLPNFLDPDNGFYQDTDRDGIVDLFDTDDGGAVSNTPDGDLDGEYDFRDTDNLVSLPIELVYFNAEQEGESIKLDWETLTEINNDYFSIEKLINGDFMEIDKVVGAGNSNLRMEYLSYDLNPIEGLNYYRLRQTDFDGSNEVSEVVQVNYVLKELIRLFPNPNSIGKVYLKTDGLTDGDYILRIRNQYGQLVQEEQLIIDDSSFQLEIILKNNLSKGVYFFRLIGRDNQSKSIPIIVQ